MQGHSKIGASSMERWSECPGSVKLCQNIPSVSSVYAEEGTRAHEIAAQILMGTAPQVVDFETLEAVNVYVNAVTDAEADALEEGGALFVECRFDLSTLYPGMFGTADAVVYHPKKRLLQVFDYKHGAGIPVEVKENKQLMYYGLGALLQTGFPCEKIELVIVQPRCPHSDGPVRSWICDALDILEFSADLVNFARATEAPNAPLKTGNHCRFCPAAGICPEIHSKALTLAKSEFSPSAPYDSKKLAQALAWLPALEAWAKNVREFAYREAQQGRVPPGWKLVNKRATRKWVNEKEAAEKLSWEFGLAKDEIYSSSLRSPAQIEKALGNNAAKALSKLVVTLSSGPTLAPVSDPRPEFKTDAKTEFANVPLDESET